jgi:hypothetical protein
MSAAAPVREIEIPLQLPWKLDFLLEMHPYKVAWGGRNSPEFRTSIARACARGPVIKWKNEDRDGSSQQYARARARMGHGYRRLPGSLTSRGFTCSGVQPAMVRAHSRACALSVTAGNSRRSSTAAEKGGDGGNGGTNCAVGAKQGGAEMRAIEQRLAKLERDNPTGTVLYAFAEYGERGHQTSDRAIAAHFPEGVPDGVTVTVNIYHWADWSDGDHISPWQQIPRKLRPNRMDITLSYGRSYSVRDAKRTPRPLFGRPRTVRGFGLGLAVPLPQAAF